MFFALDNAAEYGHWVVDDKVPWQRWCSVLNSTYFHWRSVWYLCRLISLIYFDFMGGVPSTKHRDSQAKNIFRNNFNTALSEQGTLRMLRQIHRKDAELQRVGDCFSVLIGFSALCNVTDFVYRRKVY